MASESKSGAPAGFYHALPAWIDQKREEGVNISLEEGLDAELCLEFVASHLPSVEYDDEHLATLRAVMGHMRLTSAEQVGDVTRELFRRRNAAAATKLDKGGKGKGEMSEAELEEERKRFSGLHREFMNQPFNKNRVKRTGWTKQIPGYRPRIFGSNIKDFSIIIGLLLTFYTTIGLFFWGMLSFYEATEKGNQAALHTFAALLPVAVIVLAVVVIRGESTRAARQAKSADEAERRRLLFQDA